MLLLAWRKLVVSQNNLGFVAFMGKWVYPAIKSYDYEACL